VGAEVEVVHDGEDAQGEFASEVEVGEIVPSPQLFVCKTIAVE